MPDIDKTDKIIPISWLVSILENDDVFRKFVTDFSNSKKIFDDISLEKYLESLNQYMKFMMTIDSDLPKKYFDKMNYINTYYRTNEEDYDYERYLDRTESLIPISLLHEILTNEETLDKFLNFEQNKNYFPEESLKRYLKDLEELVNYYDKSNVPYPEGMLSNFEKIKDVYLFEFEHNETLEGEFKLKKIDNELESTILRRVNPDADQFTLARAIYIELCKLTSYDVNYAARGKGDSKAEEIYNKEVGEITLDNNKLVCKSFSEIYATILNKVGIKAIVPDQYHKYVLLLCNGIIIKADATQTSSNYKEEFSLPDIVRVKLGLPTAGFEAYNKGNVITSSIDKADLENQTYQDSKLQSYENRYRKIKKIEVTDRKDFTEMMEYLTQVETNDLEGLEYTEYLKLLVISRLEKEALSKIYFSTCYQKKEEIFCPTFVIDASEYIVDGDIYISFSKEDGYKRLSSRELMAREKRGDLIITSHTFKKKLEVMELGIAK